MKHTTKLTIMATVMSLAAVQAWADQTNLVRNLNIQLVGYQQGGTTATKNVTTTTVDKVQVATADVINALGTATGNSFSTSAQLVVITPLPSGSVTLVRLPVASYLAVVVTPWGPVMPIRFSLLSYW